MTNKEAANYIKRIRYYMEDGEGWTDAEFEAMDMAIKALEQPEPCEDAVSRNAIIHKLNTMDRYVSEELTLCDTNKKFPKNEVFVVDDVYEEIVEQLPSVTPVALNNTPTDDIISRKAAIESMTEYGSGDTTYLSVGELKRRLEQLPSVTLQPKTGEWIKIGEETGAVGITYAEVKCSNCRWSHSLIIPSNFCPNCGAKMEK